MPTRSAAPRKRASAQKVVRTALRRSEAQLLGAEFSDSITAAQARRIIDQGFRSVGAQLATISNGAVRSRARGKAAALVSGAGLAGAGPAPTDVTDALDKGGPAFGAFVKSVGLAVAEAQSKLDEDLVNTAKALSDQEINVIAVYDQVINDTDGSMASGTPHLQKLPLINYLMPTAYQWSRVFLQADMKVSEFNVENGFNVQGKSFAASAHANASYGMFSGVSASGGGSVSTSNYAASGGSQSAGDFAAGSLHMEATLEPRADIQLPKPLIVQKGPSLKVTMGSVADLQNTANPPVVVGRSAVLTATLLATNGGPLSGKQLDIRCSEPLLDVATSASGVTDANGQVSITIQRTGGAYDPKKPPLAAIIRISFGLITQSIPITI